MQNWPADLHLIGKRHYPFPYDLLADLFNGAWASASEASIRSSVASSGRREDEQIKRKCYLCRRAC